MPQTDLNPGAYEHATAAGNEQNKHDHQMPIMHGMDILTHGTLLQLCSTHLRAFAQPEQLEAA